MANSIRNRFAQPQRTSTGLPRNNPMQMECIAHRNEQITNDHLMQKLGQVEHKLDKLLETVS